MDETSFQIDRQQIAEGCRRFPAHRVERRRARPSADVAYLRDAGEFGRGAWDEGGRP